MINPTVWTSGPVVVTEAGVDLADATDWQLIDPATELSPEPLIVAAGGVDSAADTEVVFTPLDAPTDVYTVVILSSEGVELVRYSNAFAVTAVDPPDVPDGVTLEWIDELGAVRFTAGGMGPNDTVRIIDPGNLLIPIRGYETGDWHAGSDAGYGYAFEMPLGVGVRFGIADAAATTWVFGEEELVYTPSNRAWLRDLHNPLLSLEVAVASTDDEIRPARQTVHKIAGRAKPIVRWDVREGRQGTVTLRVENTVAPVQVWETSFRERLDTLLESGRPLLLSMCHSKGFPPCYMAIADYTYRRLGSTARWQLILSYVEVDNPTTVEVLIPTLVTYEQAQQIPPAATYADWATVTYLEIATRTTA